MTINESLSLSIQFAAEFTEKTLFKYLMIRIISAALDEQTANFTQMITEEVHRVDTQLIEAAKANSDISGTHLRCRYVQVYPNPSSKYDFLQCKCMHIYPNPTAGSLNTRDVPGNCLKINTDIYTSTHYLDMYMCCL